MYYYISGNMVLLAPGTVAVEAGGVAYKMAISQTTYDALPKNTFSSETKKVTLYTHMSVREDGIELFGFASEEELSTFKLLISISGVGPKAALSILSTLTPEKFAIAVCTDDKKAISKASGIGPKTAARIVLELKEKIAANSQFTSLSYENNLNNTISAPGNLRSASSEALDALMVLGYSRSEAMNALKDIDTTSLSVEDIIKLALKKLF